MRVLAATKIPLYTYLYFGQDSNIRNYACNITVIRLSDKRNSKKRKCCFWNFYCVIYLERQHSFPNKRMFTVIQK